MMNMKYKSLLITVFAAAGLLSCGDSNSWTVKGDIDGASGKTLLVEAGDNGRWYVLDSVKTNSSGAFKYSHKAAGFPDIYRLTLDGKSIYFPVDSIETVEIKTDTDGFGTNYELAGSQLAENMLKVDRDIMQASASGNLKGNSELKRKLSEMIMADPGGILSYYIINKKTSDGYIFDPSDKNDVKIIGAVANAYYVMRPSDPRTSYLKRLYLSNRPRVSSSVPGDTLTAREINAFEIKLYDNKGKEHSLLDELAKNNVVLLNFSAYTAEESPAFNVALNKVYEKYSPSGFQIFQVSLDGDEHIWKSTAANLPWITVLNSVADNSVIRNYNVQSLPTSYLFNRKGELVERIDDISKLDSSVAKLL